jgi:hypothetical protein
MGMEAFFGERIGGTTGFSTRLYMGLCDSYARKADNHAYGDDFSGGLTVNHVHNLISCYLIYSYLVGNATQKSPMTLFSDIVK